MQSGTCPEFIARYLSEPLAHLSSCMWLVSRQQAIPERRELTAHPGQGSSVWLQRVVWLQSPLCQQVHPPLPHQNTPTSSHSRTWNWGTHPTRGQHPHSQPCALLQPPRARQPVLPAMGSGCLKSALGPRKLRAQSKRAGLREGRAYQRVDELSPGLSRPPDSESRAIFCGTIKRMAISGCSNRSTGHRFHPRPPRPNTLVQERARAGPG